MKLSTMFQILLVVAGVFTIITIGIGELNSTYSEANISTSNMSMQYDYSNQINDSISPLKDKFDTITDTNNGWFTRLAAGIYAIPYAIIAVPGVILSSLGYAMNVFMGFASSLGIDPKITLLITIGLFIWGIFKLLEMFNRTPV